MLFLGRDNFISWELLGAEDVFTPILNHYDTEEIPTLYRATPINAKFDWDNVPAEGLERPESKTLEDFDWVITTSAAFNSRAAAGVRAAARRPATSCSGSAPGEARRTAADPARAALPRGHVDCSDPGAGRSRALGGDGDASSGRPGDRRGLGAEPRHHRRAAGATAGAAARPRAAGTISIQYASTQDLTDLARRAGLDSSSRPNLLFRGPSPYYPVGEIEVPGAGAQGPVRSRSRSSGRRWSAGCSAPRAAPTSADRRDPASRRPAGPRRC